MLWQKHFSLWSGKVIADYVYPKAAKQSIICAKCRKFLEIRISYITSAGFSGIIQQNYSSGHQVCQTCSTTPIKYLWPCSLILIIVLPCLLHFKKKVVMGGADSFLLLIASQTYYNMTMWNASNFCFFLFCFLVQCISNWKHFRKISYKIKIA